MDVCWQDVLEFVDVYCSNFLSNLGLFVTSYRELFLEPQHRCAVVHGPAR